MARAGRPLTMAATTRVHHPIFARLYARLSASEEAKGAAEHRQEMLAELHGRVVEVGAGNGLNFKHYPDTVTEVLAVEPDDLLRGHAKTAAGKADIPIHVIAGHADALAVEAGSYDAVVASLVLCSVPDPASALLALRGALRPGGELRFYEHVRSDRPWIGRAEDLLDPLWSRVAGGCHPNRDTLGAISAAGFQITDVEHFRFGLQHVLGRAISQR